MSFEKEELINSFPCDLCISKAVCICKYNLKMTISCNILHTWVRSFDITSNIMWRKVHTLFPSIISILNI
jgi:hypothetical protein